MHPVQVIQPGFYTTVQDGGRKDYRHWGVSISGPMDHLNFTLANSMLGNPLEAALLECTLYGPTLLFNAPSRVVVTGAPIELLRDGQPMPMYQVIDCDLGTVLTLGKMTVGMRSYIAFQGGLATQKILGSQSYYFPVTPEKVIEKGALLPLKSVLKSVDKMDLRPLSVPPTEWIGTARELTVLPGPDWAKLPAQLQDQIMSSDFKIGSNDRMGYQIKGGLPTNRFSFPSSFVLPGTVQLTPEGSLLVAMADGQVTGGYPRILFLETPEAAKLAQLRTGQSLRFRWDELSD
jgi:biotin-dependent carboxylase-like uncharacterized protein